MQSVLCLICADLSTRHTWITHTITQSQGFPLTASLSNSFLTEASLLACSGLGISPLHKQLTGNASLTSWTCSSNPPPHSSKQVSAEQLGQPLKWGFTNISRVNPQGVAPLKPLFLAPRIILLSALCLKQNPQIHTTVFLSVCFYSFFLLFQFTFTSSPCSSSLLPPFQFLFQLVFAFKFLFYFYLPPNICSNPFSPSSKYLIQFVFVFLEVFAPIHYLPAF